MLSHETFANPPSHCRPIPFWFWNSKMRTEEIEAQIRDFHAKGIGGFFIHARFGLETAYLSAGWMDCIGHAIGVAEELGMEVWLYDENGFPSGVGDLKVSRVREYRSKFIDLTESRARSGETVDLALPDGEVLTAYAYPGDDPSGERTDLASSIQGNRLKWTAPEGDWGVAVYSKCVIEDPNDVVFGVDYLNPEAMQAFFDLTLKPYEEALGKHFGKTIKGIFTDEPTLLPWHHNISWYGQRTHTRVVVWDDRIEQEMMRRAEMPAAELLPHLFYQIGGATARVRWLFWESVADLYVKAFFEPYSQWCEKRGLKLTGHVLFEEGLYINTDFQADYPRLLTHLHIPGTDHLAEVTEVPYGGFLNTPRHLTNIQGEKLAASISHLMRREATISETYGCAGWGLSFEKMKWIADWQYSLGINMLCPHAVFYSIEGFRKSDAPPSENHMAGWKHYRRFADYIGRLSYLLREGRHVAKVALYYPMREFRGRHTVGAEGPRDRAISDAFDLCASVLPRLHYDYDIIPESFIPGGKVEDGRLCIGDEQYSVVIAPESVLGSDACEKVREFAGKGGKWIRPPSVMDREQFTLELGGALRDAVPPDVEIASPDGARLEDVRYVHRGTDSRHIFFFANTSDQRAEALISLEVTGAVELWDPETGEVSQAENVDLVDGRLVIGHEFAPYGSVFFVIDTEREQASGQTASRRIVTREELLVLPDEWRFEIEGLNALPLPDLQLNIRTHGGGEDFTYTGSFRCDRLPDRLMLMLDDIEYRSSLMGGMDLEIDVNGETWRNPEFGWYVDKGFKTLDITKGVRIGENAVRIVIRHSSWSGQPHVLNAPPVLLGDFACEKNALTLLAPTKTARAGSWTEFGYPFYSGTAAYTQSFTLPEAKANARLIVSVDDVRDAVEIVVNGQTADIRLWQPWEADITDLVKSGENELTIKVTNSMLNFLEANPRPSGLMGSVRLLAEGNGL